MAETRYQFFECNNIDCRLRFPGYEGYQKSKRCPACRSSVHRVTDASYSSETEHKSFIEGGCKVEVLLDNIRSAWNVGSIFRTSDGIGIRRLYLCGITPSPENPKVYKTALGAETSIPWVQHNNGVDLARQLKANDYTLWALEDTPDAVPLYQIEGGVNYHNLVMILGNEIAGVDPGIIVLCDKIISIPMLGKKQSFNVAVAFGIAASFLFYRHNVSQGSRKILPNT